MKKEKELDIYNKKIEKNYKRNYTFNIMDGAFYSFGLGFVSITTIIPLFVSKLTDSKLLISSIMAIFMLGSTLPQLFSAMWIEHKKRNKKTLLIFAVFQRLPWLLLAVFTFILTPNHLDILLIVFFVCWLFYSIACGLVVPPWFDMVTKLIPLKRRGRFFGYRTALASVLEVIGALIAGFLIKILAFPTSFNVLFILTFSVMLISYLSLLFIVEPKYPLSNSKKSLKLFFSRIPKIISSDKNYRNYIVSIFFLRFIGMSNGLFTISAIERLQLSSQEADKLIAIFTFVLIGSQTLTNILWGHFSDKYGYKLVILMSGIFNGLGVFMAVIADQPLYFYLVFMFTGIAFGGEKVSLMTIIPEFCSPEEKPIYVSLTNTVSGITIGVVSLLGGFLADVYGFTIVFAISCIMIFIGSIYLYLKVKEPRFIENISHLKSNLES